jgi:hypothetical protein
MGIARLLFIQQPGNTHGIYHNGFRERSSRALNVEYGIRYSAFRIPKSLQ